MVDVSLSVCFELGRALRNGDAGAFFEVYDGFLKEQTGPVDKLNAIKELARQISELTQEDFVLMHTSFLTSSTAQTMLVQLTEPVDVQLTICLKKLRSDTTLCTSDSGAVSDFDGSTVSCEDLSSTSTTTLDDVSTKPEILEEVSENTSTTRAELNEEDNAIVMVYREQESLNGRNGVQLPQVLNQTDNYRQLNVRRKPTLTRGRYNIGTTRPGEEQQWRNESHGHGRERRLPQRSIRSTYNNEQCYDGKKREKHHQKFVSKSHEQMALFLWKGWQQVQRELAVNSHSS